MYAPDLISYDIIYTTFKKIKLKKSKGIYESNIYLRYILLDTKPKIDGVVYGIGLINKGALGEIGIGTTILNKVYEDDPVKVNINNEEIINIESYRGLNYFLTSDNKVYFNGRTTYIDNPKLNYEPLYINVNNQDIIQISVNQNHIIFLTSNSDIYGMGFGVTGRLGLPRGEYSSPEYIDLNGIKIKQIATGDAYSLFLTETGKVLFVGIMRTIEKENVYKPEIINFNNEKIAKIFTNYYRIYAITEDGILYGVGGTNMGALGENSDRTQHRRTIYNSQYISEPIIINIDGKQIDKVFTLQYHTYFLTIEGEVYFVGRSEFGVSGDGNSGDHNINEPILIDTKNNKIVDISSTNSSTIFTTDNGEMYILGNFKRLFIPENMRRDYNEPTLFLPNENVKNVTQVTMTVDNIMFLV